MTNSIWGGLIGAAIGVSIIHHVGKWDFIPTRKKKKKKYKTAIEALLS